MTSLLWAALLVAGCVFPRLAALRPHLIETLYGRGLFPVVAGVLGRVSGATRIDLAQVFVLTLFPALLALIALGAYRTIRRGSWRRGFGPGRRYLASLAIVVWSFHLLWGLNYMRPALRERLRLPEAAPDAARLAHLTRLLAAETNRAYAEAVSSGEIVPAGKSSRFVVPRAEIAARLDSAYRGILPVTGRVGLSPPKYPRWTGWILTRIGISGFYFPLTGEATVNVEQPDVSLPFAAAHEMAHQRGTAPENEANFLAFLACHESGLAAARYSGALEAFDIASGGLWQASPDSFRALPAGLLDPGPRADRAAIRAFWRRHQGPAATVSEKVNDTYLKANAQRAGIASYDQAVELLVAWEAAGESP